MYKRSFLKITLMSLLFLIFSSCTVVPEEAFSTPWNGFTSERPPQVDGVYIITKAEHLSWLSIIIIFETKVRFDANIDMNNKNFAGIPFFKGTMDGNGKSIKNLKMDYPLIETFGLIHVLTGDGSEIKNLTIENGSIKGKKDVGAFVGESKGSVTLTGLTNKASVETLNWSAAGIIALANSSSASITIKDVKNSGAITGKQFVGGIIAITKIELITDKVENSGTIIGSDIAGGIVGYSEKPVTINNAQNFGNITGDGATGGIIGNADDAVTINNAENSGEIIGKDSAGGIAGKAENAVTIKNVGNSGKVTGTGNIGGMIGEANTTGTKTIDYAYNYQNMKFIGDGLVTITESYRLKDSAGITTTALTVAEFRNQGSFVDWDFNTIWKMGDNYPVLK